jgi:2'-5' RNA ligase
MTSAFFRRTVLPESRVMKIYEQLWSEAMAAFELGKPKLDPYLPDKRDDRRRAVSLSIPLPAEVQARIKNFFDAMAGEFPGQYYYGPEELHVTMVTLISATENWEAEFGDVEAFRGIVREVFGRHHGFKLEFRGVTAAPNAVIVQGFTVDNTLENIRADLRRTFVERGFPNRLDRRYPNAAAHVTAMRFCKGDSDWRRLAGVLAANRETSFGEMQVERIELTWGDWYLTKGIARVLEEFRLPKV